jgi:alcohol dehydrogenase YqhD (iron-dependent ADH family)
MALAGVSVDYYRHIMEDGLGRFARFATAVWGIPSKGKTDRQLAEEGIDALAAWIKEIGAASEISSLDVTPEMIDGIADASIILPGGYRRMTRGEIVEILRESL